MKLVFSIAILAGLSACTEPDDDEGGGTTPSDLCASGLRWSGGNAESPLMRPGGDCIGCHSAGEGPHYIVAGTVHARLDEPADCLGVEGAVVTITDANGADTNLTTNAAGNFYLSARAAIAMPIRARIAFDGREREMSAPQPTGACATCHTATGASGAPGRILAP